MPDPDWQDEVGWVAPGRPCRLFLKDEKTLKRNGPILLYYKSLYGL